MTAAPPTGTILWAKNRPGDHNNHLHVEPPTRMGGTPPTTNPGMTVGVEAIFDALTAEFGPGAYFDTAPSGTKWTHMGGWNRRPIAGSSSWSQHAWWNALDIGPYYGVEDQQKFYDFLTGIDLQEDDVALTPDQETALDFAGLLRTSTLSVGSDHTFPQFMIPVIRAETARNVAFDARIKALDARIVALDKRLIVAEAGGGDGTGLAVLRADLEELKADLRAAGE